MLQLIRADARRGRRRLTGRERRRLRVEPDLFFPDANHVGSGEDALALDLFFVHERAVGARVHHEIAPGRGHGPRVTAGHNLSPNPDAPTRPPPTTHPRPRSHDPPPPPKPPDPRPQR